MKLLQNRAANVKRSESEIHFTKQLHYSQTTYYKHYVSVITAMLLHDRHLAQQNERK